MVADVVKGLGVEPDVPYFQQLIVPCGQHKKLVVNHHNFYFVDLTLVDLLYLGQLVVLEDKDEAQGVPNEQINLNESTNFIVNIGNLCYFSVWVLKGPDLHFLMNVETLQLVKQNVIAVVHYEPAGLQLIY